MAEDEEPGESRFTVCFVSLNGVQLTVIGPLAGIEGLRRRLGDAPDVEVHRFEHPTSAGEAREGPGLTDALFPGPARRSTPSLPE
jgi:hypothetical protein